LKLIFVNRLSKSNSICDFKKILSFGSRVVACGRTDRPTHKHDEANSRFSQIYEELKIPIQNETRLHNATLHYIGWLFLIFYPFCPLDITNILLQNWGNYADMSQGAVVYVTYVGDVLLICWFGTQLTQHVRQNGLLLLLLMFIDTLLS